MRLIDADKLSYVGNHIGDEYEDRFHDKQWIYRDTIDNAPTIDAEPVVRCHECKYEEKCEREVIWKNDSYRGILTFCSYGERKER